MAVKKTITFQQVSDFDFDSLTFEDLNSHYQMVGEIVEAKKDIAKKVFIEKIQNEANELGLDINELFGIQEETATVKIKGTRKPSKPKYQIPDTNETWTGRGIMKKAFSIYLQENPDSTLEDLLIEQPEEEE